MSFHRLEMQTLLWTLADWGNEGREEVVDLWVSKDEHQVWEKQSFFPHSVFSISLLSSFFPFIFLLSSCPDPTPFSERHRQGWLALHDVRLFICKPQHPECQDYRPSATMYWLCDLLLIEACLVCFFLTLEYRWSRSAISKRFLFWSLMVLWHSKPRRGWGGLSLPKIVICEGSLGESEKDICEGTVVKRESDAYKWFQ